MVLLLLCNRLVTEGGDAQMKHKRMLGKKSNLVAATTYKTSSLKLLKRIKKGGPFTKFDNHLMATAAHLQFDGFRRVGSSSCS